MTWHPGQRPDGTWVWSTADLGSGWAAVVYDYDRNGGLGRYVAAAVCASGRIQNHAFYRLFDAAKAAALDLALQQSSLNPNQKQAA